MCQATGSTKCKDGVTTTTTNDGGKVTVETKPLPKFRVADIILAEAIQRLRDKVAARERECGL
jgi:hypothetical protein